MSTAAESASRSNLVDVTYQQLHSYVSGHLERTSPDLISDILKPRLEQLQSALDPFGKPSDASQKKIDSGSVTLSDGVRLTVEDADKEYVFAISDKFNIDQVSALVLLRSFLCNEGLRDPPSSGDGMETSLVDELVEAITPFFHSERLYLLRILIPLFRATEDAASPIYDLASSSLATIIPDGPAFADALLTHYTRKTQLLPPPDISSHPRAATRWAKHNAREQLVMLEVLFWTMWSHVPCDGPRVVRIFEAAHASELGSQQAASTLLLDEEGAQLLHDSATLWIVLMLEVLELERIADPEELSLDGQGGLYWSDPDSLQRIHEIVGASGGTQHACTYVAWAFVLGRLSEKVSEAREIPNAYRAFFESLRPQQGKPFADAHEPVHTMMAKQALEPSVGLFRLMSTLLTESPLFVASIAWKTGSTITDPNAVAFRSVFKGLVIALIELVPVELIPGLDDFVQVWIALFGRSEPRSISGICRQYWQADWRASAARRAVFDVARARFPVQPRPLVRLLRAMTASGFLDTDPLASADQDGAGQDAPDEERDVCNQHVFYYLDRLSTFTQAVPWSACGGHNALYEKMPERFSKGWSGGVTYTNLRPVKLPGGSVLPPKSVGRLLSGDGGDVLLVCWQHQHSGWKVLLEVITDYVHRQRHRGSRVPLSDLDFTCRSKTDVQAIPLQLDEIGVERDEGDEVLVTDTLDLIRSMIHDDPNLAEELLGTLETGDSVVSHTTQGTPPPDLVQLAITILEEALSRTAAQPRAAPQSNLITSAMSVLSALLALPKYPSRVWLYIRSTSALFGSDRAVGLASNVLAAERRSGQYTMTLALLHLVQRLFYEASASLLTVLAENPKLQAVKEEVLLRAARFVHAEVWVEHAGWKYLQVGDRFEIGRRISVLYAEILTQAPPGGPDQPFAVLRDAVLDALLFKATTSTVGPIVSTIASASTVLGTLYASRRYGDARRLIFLLESHLRLARILLQRKQTMASATGPTLLEQTLCARGSGLGMSLGPNRPEVDHVECLASYVKGRDMGPVVPLEAIRVIHSLCASLSVSRLSATIVGHLTDPEATVASLVRIVQHPYDDLSLRTAVWDFMTLAVDREPALAGLLINGNFRMYNPKGKGKAPADEDRTPVSALDTALDMLSRWKDLWELNPQVLVSVLGFTDAVWQRSTEHPTALAERRKDVQLWSTIVAIVKEELGPTPDYRTEGWVHVEGTRRSALHEAVATHANHILAKAFALRILCRDVEITTQGRPATDTDMDKPDSYRALEVVLKSEDQLTDLVAEAASSPYDPDLHDQFTREAKDALPPLSLQQLQVQEPLSERDFGDDFVFSVSLLQRRLAMYRVRDDTASTRSDGLEHALASINLDLSLSHAQLMLTESWQQLFKATVPFLRGNEAVRRTLLVLSGSVSGDIAADTRSGDMMATIHSGRLALLLSLLEVIWFSTAVTADEVKNHTTVIKNVRNILVSEAKSAAKSVLGLVPVPFHRTLLQIMYFCARHSRNLFRQPKVFNAEHRIMVTSAIDTFLTFTIDALRSTFDTARSRADPDVDQDMELLVAVFEQCTQPDLTPSSTLWLTRCQESDVIRCSMELFVQYDVSGMGDVALLRTRKQPLYAFNVLMFHMAIASVASGAERLASEGVLTAYSNNSIAVAARAGTIEVSLPELPGDRNFAHVAYCMMLTIVSGVVSSLGRRNHFFDSEASGFVQLFGDQVSRALSWSTRDPLTVPLIEEMEQTVALFSAIAENAPLGATPNSPVRRVLEAFTPRALLLLQQLNYSVTHPNHLASLLEPVTADERMWLDKDVLDSSSQSTASIVDPVRRPFLARVIHRLFRLSNAILGTLVCISGAEQVLLQEPEDWPVDSAMVVPHTKVAPGESASMGTLIELGNCTLDVLRHLSTQPAGQALTPAASTSIYEKPLDVQEAMRTLRRNLEVVAFYAVTQLAMWMSKSEHEGVGGDMDTENDMERSESDQRSSRRRSLTLAERMRRGMTGEVTTDLQVLLTKSKAVLEKCRTALGADDADVDIVPILLRFLQDRRRNNCFT